MPKKKKQPDVPAGDTPTSFGLPTESADPNMDQWSRDTFPPKKWTHRG